MKTHKQNPIQVGDKVSIQYAADRYPATVVEVLRNGRTVVVRQDIARPMPDARPMSNQWQLFDNPDGAVQEFTLRNDGSYRAKNTYSPFLTRGWSHYYSYEF